MWVREKERERNSVCVHVCVHPHAHTWVYCKWQSRKNFGKETRESGSNCQLFSLNITHSFVYLTLINLLYLFLTLSDTLHTLEKTSNALFVGWPTYFPNPNQVHFALKWTDAWDHFPQLQVLIPALSQSHTFPFCVIQSNLRIIQEPTASQHYISGS